MFKRVLCLLALFSLTLSAAAATKLIYDFEGDTQGWNGKTDVGPTGATSGKNALALDAVGSQGWNQNLAINAANLDYSNYVEMLADVTVPQGTIGGAGYVQFIIVFSGPLGNWYQAVKKDLKDGLNKIKFGFAGETKVGQPWKIHMVLNSEKAIPNKIYVDNIRVRSPGKKGKIYVTVKDQSGKPVPGAWVALGKEAKQADAKGQVEIETPGDLYDAEVVGADFNSVRFKADVPEGRSGNQTVTVQRRPASAAKPARAWVMAEKRVRAFDAHRIYGHNQVMWNAMDPFTNPISLQKIRDIQGYFIRLPGGGYANQWNWRSGKIFKSDGSFDWEPEPHWSDWIKMLKALGPKSEAMIIPNVMQMEPKDTVDWIKDARANGIKVRYVELGNEPDLDPNIPYKGVKGYWTHVDNYVKVYVAHAKAIRAAFPDIKIAGPCIAQLVHKECPDKSPWLCQKDENEYWIQKFLRLVAKEGDLIDVLSVHSYPFWPGEQGYDANRAFESIGLWKEWLPKYQGWVKQYLPKKVDSMEYALTEYHLQVPEDSTTVKRVSAVWHAAYIAEFIKYGGTIAMDWDFNTTKPGDGGGHGMLDPAGDPTRPYSERAKYWILKMMANGFTGTLVQSQSNVPEVLSYGATDRGRTSCLLLNRSETQAYQVSLQVSGVPKTATKVRMQKLTSAEYQWSEALYRPVVNIDPTTTQQTFAAPPEKGGWRVISPKVEPMSAYLLIFE